LIIIWLFTPKSLRDFHLLVYNWIVNKYKTYTKLGI